MGTDFDVARVLCVLWKTIPQCLHLEAPTLEVLKSPGIKDSLQGCSLSIWGSTDLVAVPLRTTL